MLIVLWPFFDFSWSLVHKQAQLSLKGTPLHAWFSQVDCGCLSSSCSSLGRTR